MTNEIVFALLTGLTSAVIYSLIQEAFSYLRWVRTRRFFTAKIRASMLNVSYGIMTILNINPIYSTQYEDDHLMSHEEFISEVKSRRITNVQYERIEHMIKEIEDQIEESRRNALVIPSFSSSDFHAMDNFMREVNIFRSYYSWISEDLHEHEAGVKLKEKLVSVLVYSKKDPFPNHFLDKVRNRFLKLRKLKTGMSLNK